MIAALSSNGVAGSFLGGVCATAVELLEVDAAGLAVMTGGQHVAVCTHGAMAEVGEDLQFTLGVGPCLDALRGEVLVEATELSSDLRWQMFALGMAPTGALSVASFPVRIGGARIGAMTVYRATTGALTPDQAADGYILAQAAAHLIVAGQAQVGEDRLIGELEAGFVRMGPVHQATGMVMGQQGIDAVGALARLRGAAFVSGRSIIELAQDVITGRIVLPGGADF